MPEFTYVAVDPAGQRFEGSTSAADEDALARILKSRGQFLLEASVADSNVIDLTTVRVLERITRRDVIFFTTQLATIISSGVNLMDGLVDVEVQADKNLLKRIVSDIRRDIESGLPLSSALERHPLVFDELYVAIIRAGEATGRIAESLDDMVQQLEWQEELAARVREATTYPMIIVGLLTVLMGTLVMFTIPQFSKLYKEINTNLELPWATRAVQTGATLIAGNWYVFVAIGLAFFLWFQFLKQSEEGSIAISRFVLRIPVFGDAVRKIAFSRFAHYFGSLHAAGLELLPTLALMERVIGNPYLSMRFRVAVNRVLAGESLSRALASVNEFPAVVIQMLSLGERTGEMARSLEQVRLYYDREVDASVKRAIAMFGPIALMGLAAIFVLIAVAFYLPMFNLARALRR